VHPARDIGEIARAALATSEQATDAQEDDAWVLTSEKVEPHPLCCAECRANLEHAEALTAALREIAEPGYGDDAREYDQLVDIALAALATSEQARPKAEA
jgi:hypothetical protein